MINLPLNKLKQITKSRSIKDYKNKSKELSDCDWTRTQDHLVCKRTINHLAKLDQSVRLRTKWFWVRAQLQ